MRWWAEEKVEERRTDIVTAMALSSILCGSGAFMGADFRFFFAQTGRAALWGIAFAAVMSGLGSAAHTASASLRECLSGVRGRWMRRCVRACLAGNMLLALRDVARAGEMMLPFAYAAVIAALASLAVAILLASGGWRWVCVCLAVISGLITIWVALLLHFGRLPNAAEAMGGCTLRLERAPAAVCLAALRCAAGMAPCTVLMAQMPVHCRCPLKRGAWVALLWAGQLILMNAAFRKQPLNLMLMAQPFAAMACAWGQGGYYAVCTLTALAGTAALAFSLYALK